MPKFFIATIFSCFMIFPADSSQEDDPLGIPNKSLITEKLAAAPEEQKTEATRTKKSKRPETYQSQDISTKKKKKEKLDFSPKKEEKEDLSSSKGDKDGAESDQKKDLLDENPKTLVTEKLTDAPTGQKPDILTPRRDEDEDEIHIPINNSDETEESTCTTSCLKFSRGFWSIAGGWFDFSNTVASSLRPVLTLIATYGNFEEDFKRQMGIASTILNGISLASEKLSLASTKYAIEQQKELIEIKKSIEKIRQESTPSNKLKFPATKERLIKCEKLIQDIANLTELSGCEKGYFNFAKRFWKGASSTSEVLELLCKTAGLIMVPLTTIPIWDASTAHALNLSTVCLEGGTIFFGNLNQYAKKIEAQRTQLKEMLRGLEQAVQEVKKIEEKEAI